MDFLPNHPSIKLFQDKNMFRMNTDSCLLGEFFTFNDNESLLDIGTNNGVLLLYASLKAKGKLFGIDIIPPALDLAKKNLMYNHLEAELILCDAKDYINKDKVDVIVSNPPFFKNSTLPSSDYLTLSKHEASLPVEDLFKCVIRNLKKEGRFYLVHRIDREDDIKKIAELNKLYITKESKVFDKRTNKYVSILFEFKFIKEDLKESQIDIS